MPSLQGPRLKLVRAYQILEDLKEACKDFGRKNPCEWTRHLHSDGTGECFIKYMPVPPPEWGISVGEIAYQLRSALDQLAWQVSRHDNSSMSNGTRIYFPIHTDSAKYRKVGLPQIKHLTDVQQARITKLQPYHRGLTATSAPLFVLDNVNIEDKHLTVPLVPINSWMSQGEVHFVKSKGVIVETPRKGQPMTAGTIFLRFRLTSASDPAPDVIVTPKFNFNIQFGPFRDIPSGIPVVQTFRKALVEINRLFDEFERDP